MPERTIISVTVLKPADAVQQVAWNRIRLMNGRRFTEVETPLIGRYRKDDDLKDVLREFAKREILYITVLDTEVDRVKRFILEENLDLKMIVVRIVVSNKAEVVEFIKDVDDAIIEIRKAN